MKAVRIYDCRFVHQCHQPRDKLIHQSLLLLSLLPLLLLLPLPLPLLLSLRRQLQPLRSFGQEQLLCTPHRQEQPNHPHNRVLRTGQFLMAATLSLDNREPCTDLERRVPEELPRGPEQPEVEGENVPLDHLGIVVLCAQRADEDREEGQHDGDVHHELGDVGVVPQVGHDLEVQNGVGRRQQHAHNDLEPWNPLATQHHEGDEAESLELFEDVKVAETVLVAAMKEGQPRPAPRQPQHHVALVSHGGERDLEALLLCGCAH
mmetsp:Transcript_64415/g.140256  ORF Transcript_64415/g.140256 Transcript_64415/m.140256 type:complete len:262 (-) Transcript_64415:1243-2028(-)